MNWKLAIDEEWAVLTRIVALLFALADLAESSCSRSPLVRAFVVWLLRRAEIVARDFVLGEPEASELSAASRAGDSLSEAMLLAQNFRDLALELDWQAQFAFALHDDADQAGPMERGPRRVFDTDRFLNAMRLVIVVTIAQPAIRCTGPPDTS